MAIAVDQANAGTAANDAGATTIAVNTSANIAVGGFIVASVGWWSAAQTLSSVTGGGLTWAIAIQRKHASNNVSDAIVYAQAPSGLASVTTLTANFSGSVNGRQIGISSFAGVTTSSPVDTTATGDNTTTAWTVSGTVAAGSLLIGTSHADDFRTSTITSPSIEALDWNDGANTGQTTGYRIEATGGTYAVAGTWNTAPLNHVECLAAFKADAGGGGGPPSPKQLAALGVG